MAEYSKHPAAIYPTTQDEKNSVYGHENKREACQAVNNGPLGALFLARLVTSLIDRVLELFGLVLVRVRLVEELNVVVGRVLP